MNPNPMPKVERRAFLRWIGAAGVAAQAGVLLPPGWSPAVRAAARIGPCDPARERPADAPPPRRDGVVRLSSNENPYGPCAAARRAVAEGLDRANRYPIEEREDLVAALAAKHELDGGRILPGCGSTEILRAAVAAFAAGGTLVTADPTYEDPFDYSRPFDVKVVRVPLDDGGAHDLEAMEVAAVRAARLVYVCNPNNPTGTLVDGKALEGFVRRVSRRAIVVVDEAYHDYVEDEKYRSMVPLVAEGLPVLVSRTFSKIHGLAGLRLGYALCGSQDLADRVHAHLTFAGASVAAVQAGLASLADLEFQAFCRKENTKARRFLSDALAKRGYRVFPSQTNFVMFRLGTDVSDLIKPLRARGIRIGRPFPPMTDHCRVSLGTMEDLERFLEEFDRWRRAAAA